MNPQSFFLRNDGPGNNSACVFPTKLFDQYARCCALGRKNTGNGLLKVVLSIFRPKDRKKTKKSSLRTALPLEPEQRRKNKKQGVQQPSTNKKKADSACARAGAAARKPGACLYVYIYFCSNAQPARYARSGPSQCTSASGRDAAAGTTRTGCSESLSAAENRSQRRVSSNQKKRRNFETGNADEAGMEEANKFVCCPGAA